MGDNLAGSLALSEISRAANISPYHFSRLFKESTGLSPHQYVIRERVERAKELLMSTDLPLHEVAALAGFADQSHMGRHLKRLLGVLLLACAADSPLPTTVEQQERSTERKNVRDGRGSSFLSSL